MLTCKNVVTTILPPVVQVLSSTALWVHNMVLMILLNLLFYLSSCLTSLYLVCVSAKMVGKNYQLMDFLPHYYRIFVAQNFHEFHERISLYEKNIIVNI